MTGTITKHKLLKIAKMYKDCSILYFAFNVVLRNVMKLFFYKKRYITLTLTLMLTSVLRNKAFKLISHYQAYDW